MPPTNAPILGTDARLPWRRSFPGPPAPRSGAHPQSPASAVRPDPRASDANTTAVSTAEQLVDGFKDDGHFDVVLSHLKDALGLEQSAASSASNSPSKPTFRSELDARCRDLCDSAQNLHARDVESQKTKIVQQLDGDPIWHSLHACLGSCGSASSDAQQPGITPALAPDGDLARALQAHFTKQCGLGSSCQNSPPAVAPAPGSATLAPSRRAATSSFSVIDTHVIGCRSSPSSVSASPMRPAPTPTSDTPPPASAEDVSQMQEQAARSLYMIEWDACARLLSSHSPRFFQVCPPAPTPLTSPCLTARDDQRNTSWAQIPRILPLPSPEMDMIALPEPAAISNVPEGAAEPCLSSIPGELSLNIDSGVNNFVSNLHLLAVIASDLEPLPL